MTDETQGVAEAAPEDTTLASEVTGDVAENQEETPGDDVAAATDAPLAKPKKSAQERIDELTAKFRETEREAEYWRAKATQPAQSAPSAPQKDGEPDPHDVERYPYGETDAAYIRDLARYEVRQEFVQQQAQTKFQTALQTFEQRVKEAYPDGEPAGLAHMRRLPSLPPAVQEIILASETGPKLADHLGTNPGELQRLSALSPPQQAYELAKLEARITSAPAPAKTTTSAPEPAPTLRGAGGQFKPAPDTDDFAAFSRTYGG